MCYCSYVLVVGLERLNFQQVFCFSYYKVFQRAYQKIYIQQCVPDFLEAKRDR